MQFDTTKYLNLILQVRSKFTLGGPFEVVGLGSGLSIGNPESSSIKLSVSFSSEILSKFLLLFFSRLFAFAAARINSAAFASASAAISTKEDFSEFFRLLGPIPSGWGSRSDSLIGRARFRFLFFFLFSTRFLTNFDFNFIYSLNPHAVGIWIFKRFNLNRYRRICTKVDASFFDTALSHSRRLSASEKRRRKYSRPLWCKFACGQVSSPRLYRLITQNQLFFYYKMTLNLIVIWRVS